MDDDAAVLRASALVLERAGFAVTAVDGGAAALEAFHRRPHSFSAVVSDILMEGISGLDVLREVRTQDPDTPVLLITGGPSLTTAIEAMNHGAHRYLMKPVTPEELVETVTRAALHADLARVEREARTLQALGTMPASERTALDASFSRALSELYMVYQPIISLRNRSTIGFEALVRTHVPTMELPESLFDTAALLARQPELSRTIYASVAERVQDLRPEPLLFVNVHPPDLLDPSLYGFGSPLARHARRVVLELTERASLDRLGDIGPALSDLRRLGYRLAVDDLGTGYAGLASFTRLSPEFVKLDRSLIAGIDRDPTKRRVVQAMHSLCADLGLTVISEGVETVAERDTLSMLGADYLQGYLFARPTPDLVEPVMAA